MLPHRPTVIHRPFPLSHTRVQQFSRGATSRPRGGTRRIRDGTGGGDGTTRRSEAFGGCGRDGRAYARTCELRRRSARGRAAGRRTGRADPAGHRPSAHGRAGLRVSAGRSAARGPRDRRCLQLRQARRPRGHARQRLRHRHLRRAGHGPRRRRPSAAGRAGRVRSSSCAPTMPPPDICRAPSTPAPGISPSARTRSRRKGCPTTSRSPCGTAPRGTPRRPSIRPSAPGAAAAPGTAATAICTPSTPTASAPPPRSPRWPAPPGWTSSTPPSTTPPPGTAPGTDCGAMTC